MNAYAAYYVDKLFSSIQTYVRYYMPTRAICHVPRARDMCSLPLVRAPLCRRLCVVVVVTPMVRKIVRSIARGKTHICAAAAVCSRILYWCGHPVYRTHSYTYTILCYACVCECWHYDDMHEFSTQALDYYTSYYNEQEAGGDQFDDVCLFD